jgi:hypothetical protein
VISQAQKFSYKTAIGRTKPSAPSVWLFDNDYIVGKLLDFGCGRGYDVAYFDCDGYDPFYYKKYPTRRYDTILCTYVLNTLEPDDRLKVLTEIASLLKNDHSKAYLTVRRNVKVPGYTSTGTYQENVVFPYPIVYKTGDYCIYLFDRNLHRSVGIK